MNIRRCGWSRRGCSSSCVTSRTAADHGRGTGSDHHGCDGCEDLNDLVSGGTDDGDSRPAAGLTTATARRLRRRRRRPRACVAGPGGVARAARPGCGAAGVDNPVDHARQTGPSAVAVAVASWQQTTAIFVAPSLTSRGAPHCHFVALHIRTGSRGPRWAKEAAIFRRCTSVRVLWSNLLVPCRIRVCRVCLGRTIRWRASDGCPGSLLVRYGSSSVWPSVSSRSRSRWPSGDDAHGGDSMVRFGAWGSGASFRRRRCGGGGLCPGGSQAHQRRPVRVLAG